MRMKYTYDDKGFCIPYETRKADAAKWRLRNPSLFNPKEQDDTPSWERPLPPSIEPNIGFATRPIDFNSQYTEKEKGITTFPRHRESDPTYGGRVNTEEEKRRKLFED